MKPPASARAPRAARSDPRAELQARRDIVEVCRRIYAHGWFAATDGNVSVLLEDGRVLATPTGIHKGLRMTEADLIVLDRAGNRLAGRRGPSTEIRMHLAAYDERPEIRAVVHAHPTNCIAFSIAGVSLAQCLLPEIVFTFGSIPTTAYATPTTEEVPAEVRRWLRDFDALVLDRHGSLTVGRDVADAYDKLERMEHVAEITWRARSLGPIRALSCEQVDKLRQVGRDLGLRERKLLDSPCEHCNACPAGTGRPSRSAGEPAAQGEPSGASQGAPGDEMVRRVAEVVARSLLGRAE
jgi:L-fuculose-phosphate aldolase